MRKFLAVFILVPLAIVFIAFAVANRQAVTVSFDPFEQAHPAFVFALPLFALAFLLLIAGVVVGGVAAWLRQGKWRRAARLAQAQARELRAEVDHLNSRMGLLEAGPGRSSDALPLTIPPPAA
jgi:uncharacterized integral membrane protein